jgi:hypothetical protein
MLEEYFYDTIFKAREEEFFKQSCRQFSVLVHTRLPISSLVKHHNLTNSNAGYTYTGILIFKIMASIKVLYIHF